MRGQAVATRAPPFHWWQVDLVDMSKYARWNRGARYLMTVVDIFSQFLSVKPLKQKPAELVAEALQEILLADGSPEVLQSDNGGELVNEQMTKLAAQWNIRLKHSQPYKPNTQGAVERANQSIKYEVFKYLRQHNYQAVRRRAAVPCALLQHCRAFTV